MKGIVYKIICNVDPKFCYYGSTKDTLNRRWNRHKSDYKSWKEGKTYNMSTYEYYDKYGIENFEIELVEEIEISDIEELKVREQYYIDTFDCCNIYAAYTGLTRVEYDSKRREENKKEIAEHKAEYYQKNKKEILEKAKEKTTCECGSIVSKSVLARHKKTQKHQSYLTL